MKALTKERIKKPLLCGVAFLYSLIVTFFVMIIGTVIGMSFHGDDFEFSEAATLVITEIGMLTASAVACTFVKKRHGTRLREAISVKNFDLALPVMLMLFTWGFGEVVDHFIGFILKNHMVVEPNTREGELIVLLISAVICAPIFEELICRFGWCELARGAYSVPIICIANGIFFSLPHFYNIQGFINVFITGVCFAYVYCKTRNILYTMITHAIHNALCFCDLEIIFGEHATHENGFVQYSWQYLAVNAVLVIISVIYFVKVFRKKYTENYFEVNRETGLAITE